MTYEEAITIANCWVRSRGAYTDRATWQTNNEAAKLAIEAMEKQIPKKVGTTTNRFNVTHYHCPRCECHAWIEYENQSYCDNCGQALLWEDTE